ncbi:OmpA family protein [Methylophilaceae bacterium]|nr:OmpA family protein [Methylophilaceae bacterium]
MKKSILLTALLGILVAGCSSTELQESQPLNPPQPELQSMLSEDNEGTAFTSPDLNLLELRGNSLLAKDKRGIYFDFNKYVVKQEYMEIIQAHAKYLNETPPANMKIQGYTDYRGSHEYNLSLGQKRAVAVKEALNSFGVDDSQIETVSYGKEYANLDCVEQNACGEDRRADIVYTVE